MLGLLKLEEVYDAYNGPKLFKAVNAGGVAFIGFWCADLGDSDAWLYVAVKAAKLALFEQGEITIRDMFLKPEFGVHRVVTMKNEDSFSSTVIKPEDIDPNELPPEGDRLSPKSTNGRHQAIQPQT